ncbi:MAG: tetratricopeptide repeat protein, partial [Gammaproteobacteria bacterium]|nr:tetratricopeptide repeat protein [Gammaproteobacteria bacterium]
ALAVTLTTIDSEEARENLLLVEGCIAELKGNFPLALDKYKLITSTNLNIESIKRSLNIYMEQKDLENAARVMQDVVEIIPSFIPQYADLLFILGNRDQALDLLTEYCQKYPDDLPIMLKLGRLYQRIGVQEAANWVYNYVLEKQPDNSTAKTYLAELKNAS